MTTNERDRLREALVALVAWDDTSNAPGLSGDTDYKGLDDAMAGARAALAETEE